jgi:hypothetical protein
MEFIQSLTRFGLVVVAMGTVTTWAAVFDNFETDAGDTSPDNNGIEGNNWSTINDNWHRTSFNGSFMARSQATGESATGSLLSTGITVSAGNWLSFDAAGYRGAGGDQDYVAASESVINVIRVRANSPTGTILAEIVPDIDPNREYHVNPLGATTVYIEAVDGSSSGGYGWIGLDNVQDSALPETSYTLVTSFENGFGSWTQVSGSAWDLTRSTGGLGARPYEGGIFATSRTNGSETATGVLRSPALTVVRSNLTYAAIGYKGGDNSSGYRLLDGSLNVLAGSTNLAPDLDSYVSQSWNLLALGLNPGDTFYMEVFDGNNYTGGAWLGFDYVRFTGGDLSAVPEPSTFLLFATGAGLVWWRRRRS